MASFVNHCSSNFILSSSNFSLVEIPQCYFHAVHVNSISESVSLHLIYMDRQREVGPVYVFWTFHTPRIVTTDPDHVKVSIVFRCHFTSHVGIPVVVYAC